MKKFLMGVLVSLGLAVPCHAQYCNYRPTYYAPYKEVIVKEVVTQVAVPVLVPTFNFQYVPPPCCNQPVTPGVSPQPMSQPVAQPVTGQQPVGAPAMGAAPDNSVKQLAKALLEEIKRQELQGQADDGPPVAVEPGASAPVSQQPLPQQQPQQPAEPAPTGHPGVVAMFNNCAKCHTGPQAKGGVRIFDSPGVLNTLAPRDKILDSVQSGRMPPPGNRQLAQAEIESIRNWCFGR